MKHLIGGRGRCSSIGNMHFLDHARGIPGARASRTQRVDVPCHAMPSHGQQHCLHAPDDLGGRWPAAQWKQGLGGG